MRRDFLVENMRWNGLEFEIPATQRVHVMPDCKRRLRARADDVLEMIRQINATSGLVCGVCACSASANNARQHGVVAAHIAAPKRPVGRPDTRPFLRFKARRWLPGAFREGQSAVTVPAASIKPIDGVDSTTVAPTSRRA